jgi:hypothetical protein
MGYRVHTAGEGVLVQWGTAAELDEAFGFEHFEGQEDMKFLVLNDVGNLEAWVMPEDPDVLRTMAETILADLDRRQGLVKTCTYCGAEIMLKDLDTGDGAVWVDSGNAMHCNDDDSDNRHEPED